MNDVDIVVDAHCHVMPDRSVDHGTRSEGGMTAHELLSAMDALNIAKAVICPTEKFIAVLNAQGNNYISETVQAHRDRFIGFAVTNPWFGERAADELRRSHDLGLKGLKVNSFLQGFLLNDELVHPLVRVCEELGIPVYLHTGTPISAMPFQLADLARKHTDVDFIMGHMGYSEFWHDTVLAAKKSDNIFLETSHMWIDLIYDAIAEIGADRVVFGSDAPKSELSLELGKIRDSTGIGKRDKERILGQNFLRLIDGC